MRDVPEALAARIESGASTMCHAWIVTLTDGARLGFTDQDEALEIDGVTCRADGGWTSGAAHQELGFEPGEASAEGMLDVEGVTLEDIRAGRWDGARVATWMVDWAMPEWDGWETWQHGQSVAVGRIIGCRCQPLVPG